MLINSKKLLPPAKNQANKKLKAENFLVPVKSVQYKNTAPIPSLPETKKTVGKGSIVNDLIVIRSKVISIEDILKKSIDLQKKNLSLGNRNLENLKRKKVENTLEKKDIKGKGIGTISAPKLGIFDTIKNFITNTVLGFVFTKLLKYLPQILEVTKKLAPAGKFLESFIGGMADKFITFVDLGYKAYDKVKSASKAIGGEKFEKTFGEFSGKLNTFINLAIIAGMSTMGGTDFGSGKKGKTPKGGKSSGGTSLEINEKLRKYLNRGKEAKNIERKFGNSAAQYYEELRNNGKNSVQAFKEVKRKFQPRGLFQKQSVSGLAGEGRTPGSIGKRGIGRSVNRLAIKTFGKGGAKIAGRIPIVGPLIDFGIRTLVFKEPLGKAAAGAVGAGAGQALGAWIGGSIGGIAGSVVPIIGNILAGSAGAAIGGILGGLIGDQIGVSLYETIIGSTAESVEGRAQGGQVSRGGKRVGGAIGRSALPKRTQVKPPKIQVGPVKPGNDIGGETQIKRIFNDVDPNNKDQVSSLRSLKTTSSILKKGNSNFLGQFMGVGVDLAMGQRPNKSLYSQFGRAFGSVVQQLVDNSTQMTVDDVANSILAMANGGVVPPNSPTRGGNFGEKIGQAVASMFATLIENQATLVMNSLKIESLKKPLSGGGDSGTPSGGDVTGLQGNAKEYYDYLISKGVQPNHAMGLILNLARESRFRPGVMADYNGTGLDSNGLPSGGLFQWNGGRFTNMTKFVGSDWKTNWKKQLDYAMQENDPTSGGYAAYSQQNFSSPMDAAKWWLIKWERGDNVPRDIGRMESIMATWQRQGMKQGQGPPGNTPLGTMSGSLSVAQQLASSMGLQVTSAMYNSNGTRRSGLHGDGRAMDFSNDGVGNGTPQQLAFAKEMVSKYGSKLEQLIYTPLGYGILKGQKVNLDRWGSKTNSEHYNHVHVAFSKGGFISKPTRILVGERGREFIFDADTTAAIEQIKPGLLAKLNYAKTKYDVASILKTYAGYEQYGYTMVILPIEKEVHKPSMSSGGSGQNYIPVSDLNIDNRIEAALA
jgi:hypothetical protein